MLNASCLGASARQSIVLGVFVVTVALLLQTIFHPFGYAMSREDGPVEWASALSWLLPFSIALVQTLRTRNWSWAAGALMLGWAVLRELDFQTAFTYRSVESLGFYTRPIAPIEHKLIAVLVLFPFAMAGLHLVWLLWREIRRRRSPQPLWLWHVSVLISLIAVALSAEKVFELTVFEEVVELGLPWVALLLVAEVGHSRDRAECAEAV